MNQILYVPNQKARAHKKRAKYRYRKIRVKRRPFFFFLFFFIFWVFGFFGLGHIFNKNLSVFFLANLYDIEEFALYIYIYIFYQIINLHKLKEWRYQQMDLKFLRYTNIII